MGRPGDTTTTAAAHRTATGTAADAGWIALTFDDGPVSGTYALLDILDAQGIKAIFFAVGAQVDRHPEVARAIVARGHSLQSHGYSHGWWSRMSDAAVREDIARGLEAIYNATGVRPTCVRPPYGASNSSSRAVAESLGVRVIGWTYDSGDWSHQSSAQLARNAAAWKPNSVVLAHDTYYSLWKPVLGRIITGLLARNLRLTTICGYQ